MTQIINSAFKVKAGRVPDVYQEKPEAGALVISDHDQAMYYGDGFNWIKIEPGIGAVALEGPALVYPLLAATPINPADWFTNQIYLYGSDFTVTPNTDLTLVTAGTYLFNYSFKITGDTPKSELSITLLNGVTPVYNIQRYMNIPNQTFNSFGSVYIVALASDVLTVEVEADVDSNWTVSSGIGVSILT
jgi:hypothetical protein